MKSFKLVSDLTQVRSSPFHATIRDLVFRISAGDPEYLPGHDVYVVLLEFGDVNRVQSDLDLPWAFSDTIRGRNDH